MVKPPKIRHSKTKAEPVTIELDPKEVTREPDRGATVRNDPAAAKPTEASPTGSPEGKPAAPPAPDKPGGGSAQSFGRQTASTAAASSTTDRKPGGDTSAATSAAQATSGRELPRQPSPPAQPAPRRGISSVIAGVLGGVVAFALAAGLQAAGVLPFGDGSAAVAPAEVSAADVDTLRAEIAALKTEIASPAAPVADPAVAQLSERLDALATTVASLPAAAESGGAAQAIEALGQKVAALETAVSGMSAGSQPALDSVNEKLAQLEQSLATQTAAIQSASQAQTALSSRLDALEGRTAALGESVEGQPRMALAIAATALKAAIDRGAPFATELDTYAAVAPDGSALEPLRTFAQDGVATRAEIEAEAGAAATAIVDAARPVEPDSGIVDRLLSSAQSLVSVRPVGSVEGVEPAAIAARMEAAVLAGDYAKAVTEHDGLPEAAKAASAGFMAKVKARMEADRLVEAALAGALKPAPEPAATGTNGG